MGARKIVTAVAAASLGVTGILGTVGTGTAFAYGNTAVHQVEISASITPNLFGAGTGGGIWLSGRVIEHEKGYRAQKQRVLGLWLNDQCCGLLCSNKPSLVHIAVGGIVLTYCEAHRPKDVEVATLADLRNALGVDIGWQLFAPRGGAK